MKIIHYLSNYYAYNLENYKRILLHILFEKAADINTLSANTYQKVMNSKDEEEIAGYVNKYFIDMVNIIHLKEVESPYEDWVGMHHAVSINNRGKIAQWCGEQKKLLEEQKRITNVAEEMLPFINYKKTKNCSCGASFIPCHEHNVYCLNCSSKISNWIGN